MRNLTDYDDLFISSLIEQAGGKPYKCTANVQYGVEYPRIVPFLVIYQDYSEDWDYDDRVIYCEKVETLDFCNEMHITIEDMHAMLEYYNNISFQRVVNDIEFEIEDEKYWKSLYDDLHFCKMMGWV